MNGAVDPGNDQKNNKNDNKNNNNKSGLKLKLIIAAAALVLIIVLLIVLLPKCGASKKPGPGNLPHRRAGYGAQRAGRALPRSLEHRYLHRQLVLRYAGLLQKALPHPGNAGRHRGQKRLPAAEYPPAA